MKLKELRPILLTRVVIYSNPLEPIDFEYCELYRGGFMGIPAYLDEREVIEISALTLTVYHGLSSGYVEVFVR